jgi:shikimate kinase
MARTDKIVLVGFMGTGKTTVTRLLAERLGVGRVDLDEEIEREAGCTIAELFDTKGEAHFRDLESAVLERLMASDRPLVLATGGGAVLREANREAMLRSGFVAALTASPERIIERVSGDASRPLLRGDVEERVRRLLAERKTAYDFAHIRIDTTDLSPDEVADRILAAVKEPTA